MALFETDELSFEVPEGYVDRSMNLFLPPSGLMRSSPQSLLVTRDPRTEQPLHQQVGQMLKDMETKLPHVKLLGHRERQVGALPAREARVHAVHDGTPIYQRQCFVGYYGTLL